MVNTKTIDVFCPSCDGRIRFGVRPRLFDIVCCPECEEVFEVVRLSPVVLQRATDSAPGEDELEDIEEWW